AVAASISSRRASASARARRAAGDNTRAGRVSLSVCCSLIFLSDMTLCASACTEPCDTQHSCSKDPTQGVRPMFNAFRTFVLLAGMTALFMVVGYFIGGTGGMMIALVFAAMTNLFAYWNSDKLVLRMQNAVPVERSRAPELYDMVDVLSKRAGLPTPAVYVIETDQPNAFATGRDPNNAAVAVSTGLLRQLDTREVAGVVAHELAHIRNRDTLTMTITATLAGAISALAQFGLFFGGGNNRDNPLGGVGALLMVFLAPLAAMLVQ